MSENLPESIVRIPSVLAGVAGEYFVAAELSRRGFVASISLRNTRGIDLLVANSTASRHVTIQCKTNQSNARKWVLSDKAEKFEAPDHFYIFVRFRGTTVHPSYHIVPSAEVAAFLRQDHSAWLTRPGQDGSAHKDNAIRNFHDRDGKYLDRWDLLKL